MKEEMPKMCFDIYGTVKAMEDHILDIDEFFRDRVEERLILEEYEKNQKIVKAWDEIVENMDEITTDLYKFVRKEDYYKKYLEPTTVEIKVVRERGELDEEKYFDDPEKDYSDNVPILLKIGKEEIEVKDWVELYIAICENFCEKDREKFLSFENNPKLNKRNQKHFSKDKSLLEYPVLINNAIYIETDMSLSDMIKMIKLLMHEYDFEILTLTGL